MSAAPETNINRSFKTVFIPADPSKPAEEWVITYNTATEVSCLLDRLKPYFSSQTKAGGANDIKSLRDAVRVQIQEQLKKSNPAMADKPVDDAMIDMILSMSAVDCVALQNNKQSTNFIGLMMYVDDQGKAKGLAVNPRATLVTQECGVPTQVLGDCLIARNFDDENNFRRIDFTLEEFQGDKQWRFDAIKANKERTSGDAADKTKQIQELLAKAQAQQTSSTLANSAEGKFCSYAGCEYPATMRCSRCKRSWYCSQACQKKDWKFHKANICITPAPAADAAATAAAAE